ncbi:hypothetical protein [Pleomorphomonas carboxyditropha]|uniref:Uncharacterized protein n=1 Tax=Pleomorphomonas carboxyditropha TaxID=2023338 RepID=A0A2G9WQ50_9HYPH|nr:hypothetical protein [Pleomorphomonas carboxyditropha]PIO96849.1 hypothetical protein CJ014_22935 [Pleomorphomonas carboxyditropha]
MTMCNAWRRDGDILLLTDTAMLRQSGRVASFANKVATFPHFNSAVAVRGNAAHLPSLLNFLTKQDFQTYSEFENGLATCLKRLPLFRWSAFDLVVAHVPKKGGARLWGLSNRPVFGVPAWQLAPLPCIFNEGEGDDFNEDATNLPSLYDEDDGSCVKWLAATQRNVLKPFGWQRKPVVATIGGSVVATTVNATGIYQREVGRWPDDRVGKPLDPAADFVPAKNRKSKPPREPSSIMNGISFG